jgi:hypothetical protein
MKENRGRKSRDTVPLTSIHGNYTSHLRQCERYGRTSNPAAVLVSASQAASLLLGERPSLPSVADPDPGSGAFLTPIRIRDPGWTSKIIFPRA